MSLPSVPLDVFSTGFTWRANGNAVSSRKLLVIGCEGYGGAATGTEASAPRNWLMRSRMALLPTSIDQSFSSAVRFVSGGASAFFGGSSSTISLPPFVEVALELVDLGREEIGLRTGDDDDRRVGRNRLLEQHERFAGEVVGAELRGDRAVATLVRAGRVTSRRVPG